MGIQKRKALNKQPKRKPEKKDGSQHQHLLSVQHEEPLGRRLLQEQLERWMDDPEQKPEPIQGVPHHVQRGGNQGGRGRDQDGGEDQCLGIQARGVEGVRTVRTTSRRRKSRGVSRGVTPFPRRLRRTRWSPNSPPRVSSSSPHPRVHLLSPMKHQKKSNIMNDISK